MHDDNREDVHILTDDVVDVYDPDINISGYNIDQLYLDEPDYSIAEHKRGMVATMCLIIRSAMESGDFIALVRVNGLIYNIYY